MGKDLNNKEYISNLFDSDGIKAPDSLSEESIRELLTAAEADTVISDIREKNVTADAAGKKSSESPGRAGRRFKARTVKWLAAAAAVLLAVFGLPRLYTSGLLAPDTDTGTDSLYVFKSTSEIRRMVNKLDQSGSPGLFRLGSNDYVEYEEFATEEYDADMAVGGEATLKSSALNAAEPASHSETYLQVDDVDEADIVKVDGSYIYCVSSKREVYVLRAENGKTTKVASIGSAGIENYVEDIFLKGDRIITIGTVYDNDDGGSSAVAVYDISDRSRPELESVFRQSGRIISSRMFGDYVYLITSDYASRDGHIVPRCTINDEYTNLPAADISCIPNPQSSSYIVLSSIDINGGAGRRTRTKAVFGATDDIYCNDHNLYAAVSEWSDDEVSLSTRIARASLDGLDVKFNASVKVNGRIVNQFSMDESGGYFRIATTSERAGIDVNNLYVLDENLKEVGKVAGFARDESIKAVRFMGKKAYVITYEAIDPLFVIDLADPANPRIEGEVKIDGFSTMLIPAGGGRLLGIGHATGDNGYGGQYDSGLKLALFDISNPSEPGVLDSMEFEGMSSPAQSTHLALTVNDGSGYFAVPYSIYKYNGSVIVDDVIDVMEDAEEPDEYIEPVNENGVLVFGTDPSAVKLKVFDQHKLGDDPIIRSVYIGDYIYGITPGGEVHSFRFNDGKN